MYNNALSETIDVVCPVYNHSDYLYECLNSIFTQQDVRVYVHLIDDASTDQSLSIAKEFSERYPNQMKIYVNQINCGDAVKSISSHSMIPQGKYWTYIEGDDFLINPRKFISQINRLKTNNHLIATATQCELWKPITGERTLIKADLLKWNFSDLIVLKNRFNLYCHISSIVWKQEPSQKQNSILPLSFLSKKINSEVFLVHLILKESKKYMEFQNIEGSCYRYTGKGIWSSLDKKQQGMLNEKLRKDIDAITPIWIKFQVFAFNKIPIYLKLVKRF